MEKLSAAADFDTDAIYHKERPVERYLAQLDDEESTTARSIASELGRNGRALAPTTIIIPVAAHQEAASIAPALRQYARQAPEAPFSLALGLNTTTAAADSPATHACIEAVNDGIDHYPHLDIRTSFITYDDSPTIGKVRHDLWNGVLTLAYEHASIAGETDVIALNHDIDLVKLPRHYIAAVQSRMAHPARRVAPAYTQVRHAPDTRFPNISRALFWNDFSYGIRHHGYEAGAVIPLSYYADKRGFDAARRTHEVGLFVLGDASRQLIRTGHLATSARRFIDRLPDHDFSSIWTKESFTPHDPCRDTEHVSSQKDISYERLVELVDARLDHEVGSILNTRMFQHMLETLPDDLLTNETIDSPAEKQKKIERSRRYYRIQQAMIERVLRECVGVPQLADTLEERIRERKLMDPSWYAS